jgi:hypothetical protein
MNKTINEPFQVRTVKSPLFDKVCSKLWTPQNYKNNITGVHFGDQSFAISKNIFNGKTNMHSYPIFDQPRLDQPRLNSVD